MTPRMLEAACLLRTFPAGHHHPLTTPAQRIIPHLWIHAGDRCATRTRIGRRTPRQKSAWRASSR